jgi:hypothetical protein
MLTCASLTLRSEIPNADKHYAIGDIALRPGIKRCGGAMAMGRVTSLNLFCSLLREDDPTFEFKYATMGMPGNVPANTPARIAIAVGKQAIWNGPEGMKWGVDEMDYCFGPDLGWTSMFSSPSLETQLI